MPLRSYPLTHKVDITSWLHTIQSLPYCVFLDHSSSAQSKNNTHILTANPKKFLQVDCNHQIIRSERMGFSDFEDTQIEGTDVLSLVKEMHNGLEKTELRDQKFMGGLIGFLSYDFGEKNLGIKNQPLNKDDFFIGVYDWWLEIDSTNDRGILYFLDSCSESFIQTILSLMNRKTETFQNDFRLLNKFEPLITKHQYQSSFSQIINYIEAGDTYQVNYTQQLSSTFEGNPVNAYLALRQKVPAPFSCYFDIDGSTILSCSPEQFIEINNKIIESKPIKGTRKRFKNSKQDELAKKDLLSSSKDRAENIMIVDLIRNDLGRTAKTGTVSVPKLCELETFSNVHHLVSSVSAELNDTETEMDCLFQSFPGGSITGAPKVRAMEIIAELEASNRGPYCGSVFYWSSNDCFDSNILIRTMHCKNNTISVWGGGGIVADSNCDSEYQESIDKISAMTDCLEQLSGLK